jgi:hypothetical protein
MAAAPRRRTARLRWVAAAATDQTSLADRSRPAGVPPLSCDPSGQIRSAVSVAAPPVKPPTAGLPGPLAKKHI